MFLPIIFDITIGNEIKQNRYWKLIVKKRSISVFVELIKNPNKNRNIANFHNPPNLLLGYKDNFGFQLKMNNNKNKKSERVKKNEETLNVRNATKKTASDRHF